MQKFPNNIKKNKSHKVKTYKGSKANKLSFFKSGLITKNISYLSWNNFESFRKVYVRAFRTREVKNKKNFKLIQSAKKKKRKKQQKKKVNSLIFKAHFWSPLTKKPLQVRMGKGKGSPYKWVFPCSNNRVLLEQLTTIRKRKILRVFKKASKKMPLILKYVAEKKKQIFPKRLGDKIFFTRHFSTLEIMETFLKNKLKIKKKNE
ncbi:MAG: ribosomal protein L16 [Rickettsiaceae bacterium]|nr:MAG: ribosomal protein L16 [Rickettsiaceae bacterium]